VRGQIAVVGAGLSGLVAAHRLRQAGAEPIVLEARSRVGGRAYRLDLDGIPFDAGCEAFDDSDERLRALAAELGVPTWEADPWAGHRKESPLSLRILEDEIAELAARIDPAHPEDVDGAGMLDAMTLAGRLESLGASPRELASAETRYAVASSGVPTAVMSLLAYAAKVAAGAARTGLTLRLRGGASALAGALAHGLDVRLGAEVTAIEEESGGVRIRLADGGGLEAGRAIVAVPLTVLGQIRFVPSLPEHRQLACAHARYGDVVKAALPLRGRDAEELPHLSADGVLYQPDPDLPLLALFAGAGAARRARALPSIAFVDWTPERFSRGSYLIFGPGHLTSWGHRLAEPHGRVHFAGSEASELPSYAEGAVRAGERASDEALAAG
jgi:monoamine oxidase